jgi:hypothetical protein
MDVMVARLVFAVPFWAILVLPLLVLFWFPREWTDSTIVRITGALYFFASHIGAGWLANRAARRFAIDHRSFVDSFFDALSEARVPLSFLPVVGRLFTR